MCRVSLNSISPTPGRTSGADRRIRTRPARCLMIRTRSARDLRKSITNADHVHLRSATMMKWSVPVRPRPPRSSRATSTSTRLRSSASKRTSHHLVRPGLLRSVMHRRRSCIAVHRTRILPRSAGAAGTAPHGGFARGRGPTCWPSPAAGSSAQRAGRERVGGGRCTGLGQFAVPRVGQFAAPRVGQSACARLGGRLGPQSGPCACARRGERPSTSSRRTACAGSEGRPSSLSGARPAPSGRGSASGGAVSRASTTSEGATRGANPTGSWSPEGRGPRRVP